MDTNAALAVTIDGGSGPDLERLLRAVLANPALRRYGRPELVRREAEPGTLSGWVNDVVALAPVVMAAPAFAREVKRFVEGWFRARPDADPLVLSGPRGSVTVSGTITDEQFEVLVDLLLPEDGASPEGGEAATGEAAEETAGATALPSPAAGAPGDTDDAATA